MVYSSTPKRLFHRNNKGGHNVANIGGVMIFSDGETLTVENVYKSFAVDHREVKHVIYSEDNCLVVFTDCDRVSFDAGSYENAQELHSDIMTLVR